MSNEISYDLFTQYFTTQVRAIETGHTDETGRFDYGVGFNVVCNLNNRVMYFENHLNSNVLPQNYTQQNIVDAAWSNLKPTIKTWASGALNMPSLIGAQWTPSSNVAFIPINTFTQDVYNSNFVTKVARFEVYPPTDPSSWCVGFNTYRVDHPTDNKYFDTNVTVNTFAIYRAEDEILNIGWSNLRNTIGTWAASKFQEPSLVNTTYNGLSNIW